MNSQSKKNLNSTSGTHFSCPLCHSTDTAFFTQDKKRDYYRCSNCDLTFVPKHQHLSPAQEKEIYDLHENNPLDEGYRRFLSKLSEPLIRELAINSEGLDFGSGPGPTLSLMLNEAGFKTQNYDLYYANDTHLLKQRYDFVTSTEVVEHLRDPKQVFSQLFSLLRPKGILGIMTKRASDDPERFSKWHYIQDPTHISFYSDKTFAFIAEQYHCELKIVGPDTVLLLTP